MRAGKNGPLACLILAMGLTLCTAQAHADTPPAVTQTSFSGVTPSSATLKASVDPGGAKTFAHFAYVDQATYEASGFAEARLAPEGDIVIQPTLKGEGTLTKDSFVVSDLSAPPGFAVGQTIKGTGITPGTTIVSITTNLDTGVPQLRLSAPATQTASAVQLSATGPQPLSAEVIGLTPATAYRFNLVAENKEGPTTGPDATFYTLALPPTYGPCPNDPFRSGPYGPFGHPSAPLPDCRSYEQASPTDKDGGDLLSEPQFAKGSDDGSAITFGSTFAVPGADGAQQLPFYQASRGAEGWTTRGLLPPASTGQAAQFMVGWLPDLSATYAVATRLGEPRTEALFELHRDGSPPTEIAPYVDGKGDQAGYYFVGASADASTVLFETQAKLPPAAGEPPIPSAKAGFWNVYAWDRVSGRISLASEMNSDPDSQSDLPKGAFAGPYDWLSAGVGTRLGGSYRKYYLSSERAVSADGSLFFTAAGTGQLYQSPPPRRPTAKAPMDLTPPAQSPPSSRPPPPTARAPSSPPPRSSQTTPTPDPNNSPPRSAAPS
jgi:hypothetical protein